MVTSFTVDRATWLHGEGGKQSYLLRANDGKMCCLGFLGAACGIPSKGLLARRSPSGCTKEYTSLWPEAIRNEFPLGAEAGLDFDSSKVTKFGSDILMANDSQDIMTTVNREAQLTEYFAKLGIDVKFEGEYPQAVTE